MMRLPKRDWGEYMSFSVTNLWFSGTDQDILAVDGAQEQDQQEGPRELQVWTRSRIYGYIYPRFQTHLYNQ